MGTNRLHLAVYQPNAQEGEDPTQCCALYNPARNDYRWNADFTAFRAIKLTWWDERSYIAYQSGYDPDTGRDLFYDDEDERTDCVEAVPVAVPVLKEPEFEDDIPF